MGDYQIIYYSGKVQYYLEDLITDIEWSGDIGTPFRTLSLSMLNRKENQVQKEVTIENGNPIRFYYKGKELFRGIVFEHSIDSRGNQEITVYDDLKYLLVNAETRVFKNITASSLVKTICKEQGIPMGTIAETGYVMKNAVYRNRSLWDMFVEALTATRQETGKKFWIYSKEGKLFLSERKKEVVRWVIEDNGNLLNANKSVSIEELRNSIKLIHGDIDDTKKKATIKTAKDSTSISKYGRMQHVEEWGEEKTTKMQEKANKLLKDLNKPKEEIDVETFGIPEIYSGKSVYAYDKVTGLTGGYYVTQDSHSFSGSGVYTMSLTLSVTDELPIDEDLSNDTIDALKGKKK